MVSKKMRVDCPKCDSSLQDPKGGGVLTKCPKCGLDGDVGFEMSYLRNEWEIQNKKGKKIFEWKRDD